MIIAGVDIGNSTTEVCIASVDEHGYMHFLSSAEVATTGTKGTLQNIKGIHESLIIAMQKEKLRISDLNLIRLNEAAPVIGGTAMETITETIITDSTMVGHNPDTPAGQGVAVGRTVPIHKLKETYINESIIVIVPKTMDYEVCAKTINASNEKIVGLILQKDEAVLVYNRLDKKIPIVDEVEGIEQLPIGKIAAIEVAGLGMTIKTLSNPYGLAKLFDLSPSETSAVIPISKSLIGKKSAVVVKNTDGGMQETKIKAGKITFKSQKNQSTTVSIDAGAAAIMEVVHSIQDIKDIEGERDSYVGNMLYDMKKELSELSEASEVSVESLESVTSEASMKHLAISDLLAIDTFVPVKVKGALAGDVAMEKAVAIAAMVQADKLPMTRLAKQLEEQLNVPVKVAGVEAVMAAIGAMTTKGTQLPLAILDLGGGSTDAALLDETGEVRSVHLAGAGSFVTMLIDKELRLDSVQMAENIKRYPLAKVNSLYHMTMENGEVIFFHKPLPPKLYARVVVVMDEELIPIITDLTLERIVTTRQEIKRRVFVTNALRALEKVAPDGHMRHIPNVVILGGSALDLEIPELILQELANHKIVAGRGDIRGIMGPRNAVATGLVMSYLSEDIS
ncbi:MAG: diol dehydratase reactivase subunit alpha [Firmicutes bacterium HGW-Firmicutes-2]|nr:MAG: diol dehydratase reactivase subunit alpha [Firmicutes bacterium HGW-Firmicutes-2]